MQSANTYLEMRRKVTGFSVSMAICAITRVRVPDLLSTGARSSAELAKACGCNEDALNRVLRFLAAEGIVTLEDGRFALTEAAHWLRSDIQGSLAPRAIFVGGKTNWAVWGKLADTVKTGLPGTELAFGQGIFDYLGAQPDEAGEFNAFMVQQTKASVAAILEAYAFDSTRVLADIGGGHGALVAGVLAAHRDMSGLLFDMQKVIDTALPTLHAHGVSDRCTRIAGNFFEKVPPGADTYALKFILHDWPDDRCVEILRNCREVMPPDGRILIIEHIRPEDLQPHMANYMDMQMLVMTSGGRERTLAEFRSLAKTAGLVITAVFPTEVGLSILECGHE